MEVTINVEELLYDIENKSHMECSAIMDAQVRYNVEATPDKRDEVWRAVQLAMSTVELAVSRFVNDVYAEDADNGVLLPATIVYDFIFTPRRMMGKAQALASAIHAYLVDLSLANFYDTVQMDMLKKDHTERATADAALLTHLLYSKKPPVQHSELI